MAENEPSNSVLLEKILNLGGELGLLRRENAASHDGIKKRQEHTNGRVKRLELIYAGIIGAATMLGFVWTVITFFIK